MVIECASAKGINKINKTVCKKAVSKKGVVAVVYKKGVEVVLHKAHRIVRNFIIINSFGHIVLNHVVKIHKHIPENSTGVFRGQVQKLVEGQVIHHVEALHFLCQLAQGHVKFLTLLFDIGVTFLACFFGFSVYHYC
ncbi:MAG: hypothetical protein BWY70_01772 [Bacteroidetes bacterium ADurb.Bin408]|nr:MAG: hypothetical protein BWY70_01772 [Bacteroidetes bacterium ADurb.Bin408]